ncbi:unnamed protein product [Porites evermanni]|uniref:Uncharacterized protein n=1 Tax=Porites evermanni TaxID=104178 RepID=A0ABN8LZ13_9CNID|nr:unnamed protein product [Porites evermanni]
MGFRGITPIHPTVKHSISTNQRGRTPPTGPACVRCTPVSESKILFYSADCRIFLMASEDGLGNCSAKAHGRYGRPLGARGDDAERPLLCPKTHDRSRDMAGDLHHLSLFE